MSYFYIWCALISKMHTQMQLTQLHTTTTSGHLWISWFPLYRAPAARRRTDGWKQRNYTRIKQTTAHIHPRSPRFNTWLGRAHLKFSQRFPVWVLSVDFCHDIISPAELWMVCVSEPREAVMYTGLSHAHLSSLAKSSKQPLARIWSTIFSKGTETL